MIKAKTKKTKARRNKKDKASKKASNKDEFIKDFMEDKEHIPMELLFNFLTEDTDIRAQKEELLKKIEEICFLRNQIRIILKALKVNVSNEPKTYSIDEVEPKDYLKELSNYIDEMEAFTEALMREDQPDLDEKIKELRKIFIDNGKDELFIKILKEFNLNEKDYIP